MALEDKCTEYRDMFGRLEREEPERYQRIRLYANGCLGTPTIDQTAKLIYFPKPEEDIQYLQIELQNLMKDKPEYMGVCNGLYERMRNIIDSNKSRSIHPNV